MTAPVLAEEVPASRFWIKFRDEAVFALFSPFIVCLAAGNLELEVFQSCISQDVYFLKAFAKAYEMAEECADDDDDKATIRKIRRTVLADLKVHDSFLQEWGVDLAKECSPNSATTKYTDFLIATASGKVDGEKGLLKIVTPFEKTKIAAYTVGALIPRLKLYAFLAKEMQASLDPAESGHPFKKWIDTYSSESFEASVIQIEDLLDKLSVSLTGGELDVVERLYHQAIELEVGFFCSLPVVQRSVVPLSEVHDTATDRLMIFSDFDLTCTVVDSSAILAEIAILSAPKVDRIEPETLNAHKSSTELRHSWDAISKQYTDEFELCVENILSTEEDSSRLEKKFNYEDLCKALEQLSLFEKRANSRVIELGVLKGLNVEDIKRAGQRMLLQGGCVKFFQQVVRRKEELNVDIHLISYCWCGDLIRTAFSAGGLDVLNVHSNELIYEDSLSTGEIVKKMESPMDKVQAFKNILCSESGSNEQLSVYIGDSVGDLLCLLEADIGIVIGSSPSLRRLGRQFGVSFVPLSSGVVQKQKAFVEGSSAWKGMSGVLYEVSGWAEIRAFILGSS